MLVILEGSSMLVRLVQPLNACLPMLVTPSGIVMLVSLEQPENAASPIAITGLPLYVAGIRMIKSTVMLFLSPVTV